MLKKLLSVLMLAVTMLSLGSAFPFEASAADNGLPALSPDCVLAMQGSDQLKEAIAGSKGLVDAAQPDATYTLDVESYVEIPIGSSHKIKYNVSPSGSTVTWKSSNTSIATVNSSGLITAKKPFNTTITGTVGGSVSDTCEVFVEFIDVMDSEQFYFFPVYWAADVGVTSGYTDSSGKLTGKFGPNDKCTRGQIVTFLYRMLANQYYPSDAPTFKDVKKTDYFYDAVRFMAYRGVTTGYSGTNKFGPNDKCTRAQVVTFMYRLWKDTYPADANKLAAVKDFKDVKKGTYYYDAVRWAVAHGVTTGYSGTNKFGPDDVCTRAQVVTFLYRFVEDVT